MTTPTYELNPDEVQVGTANGPGIYLAPAGTKAPADTTSEWPAPWAVMGYLSDDGPTVGQSTNTESLTPWQSISPIRTVITERSVTLQFILWQLNPQTMALYFGAPPPVAADDGSFALEVRSDAPQQTYAVGIDAADGERVLRIAFERATLSDAGDMQIQRGAAVPLDCTLTALDTGGLLATVLVGPGAGAAPPANVVTVTNPGPQDDLLDAPIAPLNIVASSTGGGALSYAATGLPAGLAIAPVTGAITGTPTAAETANVSVTVTDSTSAVGTTAFTWDIA